MARRSNITGFILFFHPFSGFEVCLCHLSCHIHYNSMVSISTIGPMDILDILSWPSSSYKVSVMLQDARNHARQGILVLWA